jgi:hypothetical protein
MSHHVESLLRDRLCREPVERVAAIPPVDWHRWFLSRLATRGKRPAVSVTIGDHTYRTTAMPMGGRFMVPLSAENRTRRA